MRLEFNSSIHTRQRARTQLELEGFRRGQAQATRRSGNHEISFPAGQQAHKAFDEREFEQSGITPTSPTEIKLQINPPAALGVVPVRRASRRETLMIEDYISEDLKQIRWIDEQ